MQKTFKQAMYNQLVKGEKYESENKRRVVRRSGKALQVDKGIEKPCYYDLWRR